MSCCFRQLNLHETQSVPLVSSNAAAPPRSPPRIRRPAALGEDTLGPELPRFGPLYYSGDGSDHFKPLKEEAWKHVLGSRNGGDGGGSTTTDQEHYLDSIRDVAQQAKDTYADNLSIVDADTHFREMMKEDGCFQLQLVILILGGGSELGYDPNNVVFGKCDQEDTKKWMTSMCHVGNQIPMVVLHKLMEQKFFQEKIKNLRQPPPADLFKCALYELLVAPAKHGGANGCHCCDHHYYCCCSAAPNPERPIISDLLDGLYQIVIGSPVTGDAGHENDRIVDLEHGEVDREFPSATELKKQGICFKILSDSERRRIRLESNLFGYKLYLPSLRVEGNTMIILEYLKTYEKEHQPDRRRHQLGAYLCLMKGLVRTKEDVRLLSSAGIIDTAGGSSTTEEGGNYIIGAAILKEKLPADLARLADGESSQNLLHLRLQINDYYQPKWGKLKKFISIVAVLTAVQTLFTVLSYVHDVKH